MSNDTAKSAEVAALRARVAELEQRQAQLEASARMLQLVMDTIPLRIFWKDAAYRYLGCNRLFAEEAHVEDANELVGKVDFDLPWGETAHLYRADDVAVVEGGVSKINFEEPLQRAGDSLRWVRTSKVPLRDENGQVIGVFGCFEDITERHVALAALRASEERHRTIFQQASDGIFITDARGACLQVNPAASRLLGFPEHDLMRLHLSDLLAEEHDKVDALEAQSRLLVYRQLQGAAGRTLDVEISVTRLTGGGFEIIVRDVTQQRKLEEQMRQAQRMETLGRLAGGVAHDFNNLLTIILSSCGLAMQRSQRLGVPTLELTDIRDAAVRAANLTQQLLAVSRRQVLRRHLLDINSVVSSMENLLRRLLGDNIQLEIELGKEIGAISADEGQIEQVLVNLVANACDAMPAGGSVGIRTDHFSDDAGEWVRLTVSDTGPGIEAHLHEQIFEPFFSTKGPESSGLGLASVMGIVEQNEGRIEVHSEPGQGAAFHLFFARGGGGVTVDAAVATGRRDGARLVLVEDDDAVRASVGYVLTEAGHHVIQVASAVEARDIIDEEGGGIDLVVSDVVMPGMSGMALAHHLGEHWPKLPVLLLSGYSEELLDKASSTELPYAFLAKPFSPEDLLAVVEELLVGKGI